MAKNNKKKIKSLKPYLYEEELEEEKIYNKSKLALAINKQLKQSNERGGKMKYLTQMEVESIIDGAYKARLNWGEFFSSLKTHAEEISPAMTNKLRKGIREILEELTIQSMIHGKMQTFPEYMRQHSIRLKDGFSQALKLRGEKDVKRKKCC